MTCFEWAEYQAGDQRVLALAGRVDIVSVQKLKRRLRIVVRNTRTAPPVVDLSGLRSLDPCGARALVDAARLLHPSQQITIRGANPIVRRILDTVAADTFFYEPARPAHQSPERQLGRVGDPSAEVQPRATVDPHRN
jgi:anti-anti-sigma factor